MNLIQLTIQNFKQYVDPLVIDIPQQATIGVIGTNGVGKTTLFQAIEWCLYNPSTIAGRDIRPRGRSGNPKVTITLESRDASSRWIVERELKRASTSAAVYEVDEHGQDKLIVQGTREVTEFVSTRLIDLSHKAFVATFFTRQKELHFFGDMRDTDRRREVGKLLGLETIRRAQIMIGEERTTLSREAQLLHKQYAAEIGERDLDIELADSEHAVTESTTTVSAAMDTEAFATAATAQARSNLVTAAALRDRHTEVRNRFEQAQANQQSTQKQQQQRDEEIARLERARIERDRLVPIAGRLADLNRDVLTAEGERNRSRRKTELERERSGQATTRTETVNKLASEVQSLASENADPQWTWSAADASAVPIAVERLKQVATAHPVNHAEHRHTSLIAAKAASEQAINARTNLDKYLTARNGLLAEQKSVLSDGDPTSLLAAIAESGMQVRQELTAWETERKSLELDLGKRTRVLTNIRNSNFDDGCPTCGRKFSEHDEHDVLELFAADIDSIHSRIREGDQRGQKLGNQRKALEQDREKQAERQLLQKKIEDRLARSVGFIDEQRLTVANLEKQAASSLQAAGVNAVPTENDINTAARKLGLARLLQETMSRILIYAGTIESLDVARQQLDTDLALLSDVAFDERDFASLVASRDAATTAATQIDGFDRELLQLPIAMEDREKLAASMSGIEKQIADIKQELFGVGFDPELLQVAERNVTDAEQTERAAMRAHQQAQLNHQKVVSARQSIEREHNRIRSIVLRADSRQREADELTQMYNLFGEFEQFVVSRLTPALSEMTSDLVRQVTDGKYDDVSFDDNFGVLVRDGDELPFPLATFSGGERDAIALCARLALSQMIGLQAAEQPGFLVLDEVFGSLDRDRRSRLLELFGNLSAISEGFQQVFIISHVDDVRTAPIFDELWMIQEGEDGKSSLSNLAPGTDIGEL